MVMLVMLFLIPLVSAFEFDNIKTYDEDERKYTIKNAFGIGSKIAEVELLTPNNVQVIDRGKGILQKVAEFKITNAESYENVFKKMEFYNVDNNNKKMPKDFELRYRVEDGFDEFDVTETECNNPNDKFDCETTIIKHVKSPKYKWVALGDKKNILPKGEIVIGVFVDIDKGEHGDWVATIFGERLNKWATWTESLNVDIVSYWKFDETSGDVAEDSVKGDNHQQQQFNGTIQGATHRLESGTDCLIGNCLNFTYLSEDRVRVPKGIINQSSGNFTIAYWVNGVDLASQTGSVNMMGSDGDSGDFMHNRFESGNHEVRIVYSGGWQFNSLSVPLITSGVWHLIVLQVTNDGNGNGSFWIDGVLKYNDETFDWSSFGFTLNNFTIAGDATGMATKSGGYAFDEIGTWSRYLTGSEIVDLYNSGSGITYTSEFNSLDLVYPTNTTYQEEQTNMSYTYSVVDYCWYSLDNGVTNSTPVTAGTNFTGLNSGGGSSTWTTYCNDSSNTLLQDSVTFFVNPTITIRYPTNTTYNEEQTVMNYTYTAVDYCWYSLDEGVTNSTPVVAGTNFTGLNSGTESSTWRTYCNDSLNALIEDSVTFFVNPNAITTLINPTNDTNSTNLLQEFEVNATSLGARLRNQTIYIWVKSNSSVVTTNYSTISGTASSRKFNYTFGFDDVFLWNAITEGNTSITYVSDWDINRTFTIDSSPPELTLTFPNETIDYFSVGNNLRVNWTINDTHLSICILEYQKSNTTVNCNDNGTFINITDPTNKSLTFYANDTFGNQVTQSINWSYKVFYWSETYNTSVHESQDQTFKLNISSSGTETVTANFTYNNTNYTSTKSGNNTDMNFTFRFDVPLGVGTFNFSWNVFYGNDIINTSIHTQTIDLLNLSACGTAGLNTPFINFTAKDEIDNSDINFTIEIGDWIYYYLGTGTVNRTYQFIDQSANISSFAFCATPNLTIQQNLEVKYSDFDGNYPQRTYKTEQSINNTVTNVVLYLLKTVDGEDITLQVVSPAGIAIEGVFVNASRIVSGNRVLLGSGTTGADGGLNFFLNPDFLTRFTFVKKGYDTFITSFQPKDSTITMGALTTANQSYDFIRGISWAIEPLDFTLNNNTYYQFNFTFKNTGYWVVDEWGFILTNKSGSVLGTNTSTDTGGGNLSVNVSTGNHSYILMNYFWNIGGNYSNATKVWGISDQTSKGTLDGFVSKLKSYMDDGGIFGLTQWGLSIIIFFGVFILTGTLSYTTGIYSPTAIAAFATAWIWFFDAYLGLLPLLPGSIEVNGVYSIIAAMITFAIGIREMMR